MERILPRVPRKSRQPERRGRITKRTEVAKGLIVYGPFFADTEGTGFDWTGGSRVGSFWEPSRRGTRSGGEFDSEPAVSHAVTAMRFPRGCVREVGAQQEGNYGPEAVGHGPSVQGSGPARLSSALCLALLRLLRAVVCVASRSQSDGSGRRLSCSISVFDGDVWRKDVRQQISS